MSRALLQSVLGATLLAGLVSCGSSTPASPSPSPAKAATSIVTSGRAVDALTQAGYGNIVVTPAVGAGVSTDGSGAFTLNASSTTLTPIRVAFSGPGVVSRLTYLKIPGTDVLVSLIPSGFNLPAFDQMFRVPALLRWVTPPPVLVETRALQFTDVAAADQIALSDQMSDNETSSLVADLTWALPQMTGGAFGTFASVTTQTSAENASVHLLNSGVITVARVVGLTTATGSWGYSRWQFRADGSISGGIITLDRDFERSGSPFRRSLRTHELGHALGYNHVTVTPSVMNPAARIEPNDFDLAACRIAFARPTNNVSPDTDPSTASLNRLSSPGTWSAPIR